MSELKKHEDHGQMQRMRDEQQGRNLWGEIFKLRDEQREKAKNTFWLVKGDYWILYLDPEYRTVIVGTPDRKYLWIMAREPSIPEETYRALVERSTDLGFATDRLLRVAPPPD